MTAEQETGENLWIWDSMYEGISPVPLHSKAFPIVEAIQVIEFCLLKEVERPATALAVLDLLTGLRTDPLFLNWKAMVEYEAKDYVRSVETMKLVLEQVQNANVYFNIGRAAFKANLLLDSKWYLEQALELEPNNSSYKLDYSITLCYLGRMDLAFNLINDIDIAQLDEKNRKVVEFNKGWHYIRKGDFKTGMSLLHIGRQIKLWGSDSRKYNRPKWDGIARPGVTILLVGEGGIGDEVINARFAQIIVDRGMSCVMSTNHKNVPMLSTVEGLSKVFENTSIDEETWDFWAPCMDLPFILGLEESDISNKPYLKVNEEYREKWEKKIVSNAKLKIGIRWKGNPLYELELHRTLPINLFKELNESLMDIEMFSLQVQDDGEQCPNWLDNTAVDFKSWEDTVGAMANLDLVITSCTSVAHVAGALGIETWVLSPILPYYVWADMKEQSMWYNNVKVFRQSKWQEWEDVFDSVRKHLITKLEQR